MKTNVQSGVGLVSDSDECRFGKFWSAPPPGAQQRAILQPGVFLRGVTDSPIERSCGPGGPALHRKHVSGWRHCVGAAIMVLALIGCGRQEKASQDWEQTSKPVVVSASYPLHSFAERIGGSEIQAMFLAPPDIDPAYWEPSAEDISRLQQADLLLRNGAGYEKWLATISLPENRSVDTSAGFADQFIREEGGPTHQHGPGGEHSHGEVAFTTWLDLSLAIQQAQAAERALVRLCPNEAAQLRANCSALTNELAALDREFLAWGEGLHGQPLLASHPVYQYFGRRYGLNLRSVHWEPDEMPDDEAWRELEAVLREHPARWMIWEGEPRGEAVERLKSLGVGSVVVSPCGNASSSVGFTLAMKQNVVRLKSMDGVE